MTNKSLIEYYADIHASRAYGNTSVRNGRFLRPDIKLLRPASIIDYGCGQSRLLDQLELDYPLEMRRYDPAIPAFSRKPEGVYDLLISIDVLEHIPEPDLDPVIEELRSLCRNAILIVDTIPARLILPNGENAHATVKPKDWWAGKLGRHFPHLVPIRTARSWRAAFRTWDHTPEEEAAFRKMRRSEDIAYYRGRVRYLAGRLFGKNPRVGRWDTASAGDSAESTTVERGTIVGFYTRDSLYEQEAARMRRSAEVLGLPVELAPMDSAGSWVRNAGLKAGFLRAARERLHGPLVYVDVDAVFHGDPWPLLSTFDCDVAVHVTVNGELQSGTILLNDTPATRALLEDWVAATEASPDEWDQRVLHRVINDSVAKGRLKFVRLPNTLCWITDRKDERPTGPIVIEHLQASRELKIVRKLFGRIPGKVKRRRNRVSEIEKKLWKE